MSELVAFYYSTIHREVVSKYSTTDQLFVDEYTTICMPSAENRPRTCSASKEARRDVNDKSPMIGNREKIEKKIRNFGDVYKLGRRS